MSQLPVPGRDTVYVWVGRDPGGRPGAAGRLLRRAGAALLGRLEERIVVEHGPGGRPVVRAGAPVGDDRAAGPVELPVSVSRTGGVVVVAARRGGPVGVDVERTRPLPALALARRWYDPAEAAWLAGRPADGRAVDFLLLWTAKEAVGKALGTGLRDGGLRRRVPLPDGSGLLRPLPDDPGVRVGRPDGDAGAVLAGLGLVLAVAVAGDLDGPDVVVTVDTGDGARLAADGDGPVGSAQWTGHGVAAVRSASTERTSLPVVVRGS